MEIPDPAPDLSLVDLKLLVDEIRRRFPAYGVMGIARHSGNYLPGTIILETEFRPIFWGNWHAIRGLLDDLNDAYDQTISQTQKTGPDNASPRQECDDDNPE